ncbi:aminotransferase [Corynebacterium falsenii DSM 44353]|uniref:aminotransferase class V-fold PLP-dependent enzyme n=1 Tax=Corynebacterium falsenii TaxID=108486 RepID=UPI0003E96886|nr:aminotransferase class V-fold PLP-dependent enzyme [Corynebacterium falsenii]AHI04102.1 aminotransferase [Corynebacterium falsenii DSM 44353]UBI04895.1 aminotransferase class V-fold PLP-dependent enzyme [Corynebacterium falsenii]
MFDNPRVRGLYASLSDGWTYMNAQDYPQVPERVSAAVSRSFRASPLLEPMESPHGVASDNKVLGRRIGEQFVDAAKNAVADLTGALPSNVVLGSSRAALLDQLASVLYRRLRLGQEVVLSRIDDPANIRPWRRAADLYGARVRWAEPDLSTGVLPAWQFANLVGPETTVVAIAAANRYVGSVTDVRAVGEAVHNKSRGLFVVDVNSYAPYRVVDIDDMQADVLALDISSIGGPTVGALVFRDSSVLASIPFNDPRGVLGVGGVSEGLLGGVPEAVEHLARLDDFALGSRRHRVADALPQATRYMNGLARRAVEGLQALGTVHVIGVDGESELLPYFDAVERVPRVSFIVEGVPAAVVVDRLLSNGVVAGVVKPGDSELLASMGVFEEIGASRRARRGRHGRKNASSLSGQTEYHPDSGAVAIGFAPHNTAYDVDQLVRAVASLR